MKRSTIGVVIAASLGLGFGLGGCADDGKAAEKVKRGSASGSGSEPGAHAEVPAGVAKQYVTLEKEIKAKGGEQRSGAWRVAYIVEPAEPWYENKHGRQVFREPAAGETHHIEIIPFEAETGRVVPNVPIKLEVLDSAGNVVDTKTLNFLYGEFFHYANNFAVPKAGTYMLRATLQPPTFLRHGEKGQAPALAEGATVTFTGVELKPQQ